jgi:redox-sensitive bicupin YhaK (pirin superfamily)
MSAGTGLSHSEYNVGKKPVHLYQIWIYPDKHGLRPSNDQRSFKKEEWHNQLLPIASGQRHKEAVRFHSSATIYRAELDAGRAISYETTEERQIFLYLTSGSLVVNRNRLLPKYQARIDLEKNLMLQAEKKSDFILIDLPSCRGWGYDQNTLQGARF